MSSSFTDFYAVLGISQTATQREITVAYRKLALREHPDKHPEDKENATAKFKLIGAAHDTLKDPAVRANYDYSYNKQKAKESARQPFGPSTRQPSGQSAHQPSTNEHYQKPSQGKKPRDAEYLDLMLRLSNMIKAQTKCAKERDRLKRYWRHVQKGEYPECYQDYVDFGGEDDEVKEAVEADLKKKLGEVDAQNVKISKNLAAYRAKLDQYV